MIIKTVIDDVIAYVGLNGLSRFGLFDAIFEVDEELEPVLVQHARKDVTEQGDGPVDDGHAQRQRSRNASDQLRTIQRVQRARIVFQGARSRSAVR